MDPSSGAVLSLRRIGPGSDLPPTTAMLRLLDDVERARAARTVDAEQAASFVAGRYLLRALTADLLGIRAGLLVSGFECPVCGPDGVPDHGRPAYLLHGEPVPLALSLSRAGGFVLLGALALHGTAQTPPTFGAHGTKRTAGTLGAQGPQGPQGTNRTAATDGLRGTVGTLEPLGAHGAYEAVGTPTSHTAVPWARPGLGVDLTTVAAAGFEGFDDVALTLGERAMVGGLPAGDRTTARAVLWARKEALIKALGTGFADRGPESVEVLRERRVADLPSIGGEALEPLGLVAAVAIDP